MVNLVNNMQHRIKKVGCNQSCFLFRFHHSNPPIRQLKIHTIEEKWDAVSIVISRLIDDMCIIRLKDTCKNLLSYNI